MSDKVNMALDDIIKLNRKENKTVPRNVKTGRQIKGGKRVLAGRGRPNVAVKGRQNLGARGRPNLGAAAKNAAVRNNIVNNSQTKKLVQKLVKKALSRSIASPAARPLALANRGGIRARLAAAAPVRATQRLQLARVNPRSRVIGGPRFVNRPVVQRVVQRGPGFRNNIQTVYEDELEEEPVQIVQRPRPRPIIIRQQREEPVVVERVMSMPRQRQRVIQRTVQQPRQRVIVQRQQPVQRFVQQPRQRFAQQPRERVVVVQQSAPRQRVQKVIQRVRPQQQQVIQRVQRMPQQQQQRRTEVIRYVEARDRKNNNFRNAVGIDQGGRRYQQADRFEPSTSFIRQTVVRRGRGFNNTY